MKKVFLIIIPLIILSSCGNSDQVRPELLEKTNPNAPLPKVVKLEVDTRTITSEFEINDLATSANFIKNISEVNINEINSDFLIKGNYLYQFTMIDNLKVGLNGNVLEQRTNNSMTLSFSAIHLRKINLQTLKVEHTQIIDNFFNKQSLFPAVDGEFWVHVSKSIENGEAMYLFKKVKASTLNCQYKNVVCEVETDEYIVAHYDFVMNKMRPLKAIKGNFRRIKVNNSKVFLLGENSTELKIDLIDLNSSNTDSTKIQKHQNGTDHINRSYFNNNFFYITGLWSNGNKTYPELVKLDFDLNIKDDIVFNDQLSGPDYNIDVLAFNELKEENYFRYLYASSIGNDSLLIFSSYLASKKKMVTDIAIIDSSNGQVAKNFNKGKVLRIDYLKDEFYYNDSNYLYIFRTDDSNLKLKAYNKDSTIVPINGANQVSFKLDPSLKNPDIRFVSIQNGSAIIALATANSTFVKKFNIH